MHLQRVIPIGNDDQHKNDEYLDEILGKIFEKSESGDIEWDNSKPDGTPRKQLNVSRLKEIGWQYKIELEEGLKSTILEYEKNFLNK